VGDLPAPGILTTQQGVNQWIAQSLLYIDDKISGGTDNDMEFDGDIEFIGSSTQSLVKYNGGDLDIKVSGTDLASATTIGSFTTTGLAVTGALTSTTFTVSGAASTGALTATGITIPDTSTNTDIVVNAQFGTGKFYNLDVQGNLDVDGIATLATASIGTLTGDLNGVVTTLTAGSGVDFTVDSADAATITGTGTVSVDDTVIRTTGDQTIDGITILQNKLTVKTKTGTYTDAYNSLRVEGRAVGASSKSNVILKTYINPSASELPDYIEYFGNTTGNNMIVNRAAVQTMIDNGGGSGLNFKGTVNSPLITHLPLLTVVTCISTIQQVQ
jgi:hypothetical protein